MKLQSVFVRILGGEGAFWLGAHWPSQQGPIGIRGLRLDTFDVVAGSRVDLNQFTFIDKNWRLKLAAGFNGYRFADVC